MMTLKAYGIVFLMVMGLTLLALPPKGAAEGIDFVTVLVDEIGNVCFINANTTVPKLGTDAKDEVAAGMDAASVQPGRSFRGIMRADQTEARGIFGCLIGPK